MEADNAKARPSSASWSQLCPTGSPKNTSLFLDGLANRTRTLAPTHWFGQPVAASAIDGGSSSATPGEILLEEFLRPLALSQTALARALRVPPRRINEIVLGKRAVTADTDLRLTRYFGLTPGFFLGLQADHDLMQRRRELGADLELIAPRAA